MSLSNRPEWMFRATPRELQFLVVGIALGILCVLVALRAAMPAEALIIPGMAVPVLLMVLGAARSNNRGY